MKHYHLSIWPILFGMLVLLFATQIHTASADPAPADHKDIRDYEGPGTCAMCKPNAAQEVVKSLHYQMRGEVPFRVGWEAGKLGGMNGTY